MTINQTVAAAIAALNLGEHFTFDALTDALERQRGRKIKVAELPALGAEKGFCALLLLRDEGDYILHAHSDSALHTQQFILHELAHLALGHCDTENGHDITGLDGLLPDIPAGLTARALARSVLATEEEVAAESLADIFAARIRGSVFAENSYTEIFG